MRKLIVLLPFLFIQFVFACPIGKVGLSADQRKLLKKSGKRQQAGRKISSLSQLPTATSAQPWGGPDSKKWRPEAILANATSYWLNKEWAGDNVSEVLVSVPVKMNFTAERVYGDGQTNASLNLGPDWNFDHPQLVATLVIYKNGQRKVIFHFSTHLKFSKNIVNITSFVEESGKTSRKDVVLQVKKINESFFAEWSVPPEVQFGDLYKSRVIWVRPDGWNSSFPMDFRIAVYDNQKLAAQGAKARTAGKKAFDPLDIFEASKKTGENSVTTLLKASFGPQWIKNNQGTNELRNDSIHGEVHLSGNKVKTSVGGGLTWLVDRGDGSTFKNLYTCFDARNFQKESEHGVPSGGGWHEIGDAAETIINNLETAPVTVGFATGLPDPQPPDKNEFAWGLSDVATIRLLLPGEAVVTPAGDQTWKEDEKWRAKQDNSVRGQEKSGGGRNYHWFFFSGEEPTCTEEWVHSCRPSVSNHLGLECQ